MGMTTSGSGGISKRGGDFKRRRDCSQPSQQSLNINAPPADRESLLRSGEKQPLLTLGIDVNHDNVSLLVLSLEQLL